MAEALNDTRDAGEENSSNVKTTTLLLVGRAGNGKSSVGNSILRQDDDNSILRKDHDKLKFEPRGPSEVTRLKNEIAYNDKFVVVDCSGIGDTGSDVPDDISSIVLSAFDAMIINKNTTDDLNPVESDNLQNVLDRCAFDALIFVLKYGVRFTKQEKDAVQMVKSIFGENVFRDRGILVFSYGDNFETNIKESEESFENWCREQRGDIRTLFEDVSYRCVLFDNKTKDKDKLEQQRCKLNEHILTVYKQLQDENKPRKYFLEEFICIRKDNFDQRYNHLDKETKQLLTIYKKYNKSELKNTTLHLADNLKKDWLKLKTEIEEQIKYFTWEEKIPIDANEDETTLQKDPNQTKLQSDPNKNKLQSDPNEIKLQSDPNEIKLQSDPNETKLQSDPNKNKLQSDPNEIKLQSDPNEIKLQSDPNEIKLQSDPNETKLQSDPNETKLQGDSHQNETKKEKKQEKNQFKLNKLHYDVFRSSHKCEFNIKHTLTLQPYTDYLKAKQLAINNNIQNLIDIEKSKCILS